MPDSRLPRVHKATVGALAGYLRDKSWSQRPPIASARVLALMVELWAARQPFPTRQQAARHLGVSVPTVDLVLRRHRTGVISIVYDGAPVVRGRRWIVPSPEVIQAANRSLPGRRAAEDIPRDRRQRGQRGFPGNLALDA
jgi:hypothetical protein